jgi:very-short-patch-repair endonuclease
MDRRTMFYGAKSQTFDIAKQFRDNMTKTEKILWSKLSKKQILGLRFKAQHPISHYIADFYCHKLKLVIEVDGGIHKTKDQKAYDINRSSDLEDLGLKVIRFTNEEISNNLESILERITVTCEKLKESTN